MISAEEARELTSTDILSNAMAFVEERIKANTKIGFRMLVVRSEDIDFYVYIAKALASELAKCGYSVCYSDYDIRISW